MERNVGWNSAEQEGGGGGGGSDHEDVRRVRHLLADLEELEQIIKLRVGRGN